MNTRQLQKNLGTALMLIAVLLITYIYLPIVQIYFFPPTQVPQIKSEYSLFIPKIKAYAPIVIGVDPWNEKDYKEKLKQGIAQAKGSALPGKPGSYLFAHSSDYPWNITRYNTAFFKLNQLRKGDKIYIHHNNEVITFVVTDSKEIWPNEIQYLKDRRADLTLQTCTPIGTDLKRLLIFAKKV
jgi:LPXTG-site transpeptidase (sortase) family protein